VTRPVVNQRVVRSATNWPAWRGALRTLAAAAAVSAGMAAAWLASGGIGVLAGMAVVLAAGNGYAKAYSP
jgi:hypothetical protein